MPVSAAKQKLYPGGSLRSPEWLAIRDRILKRAGNRCELCGVENYALGGRCPKGMFWKALPTQERMASLEWPKPGQWGFIHAGGVIIRARIIRIVLTIMHLNHDPTDNRDENLKAGCQRCHNRHDAAYRSANARKVAYVHQLELL